jgi:uncharacterized protein (DUF2235 family)
MAKKIILFADGTGNAFLTQESNIWRIYQSLDSSDKDQVACYIQGVGTSTFKPWAIFDGATGIGVPGNVLKLYRFLCWNWQEGAEIYMFGFSRGAFTIRTLIAMIASEGLIARLQTSQKNPIPHEEMQRYAADAYSAYRYKLAKSWKKSETPPLVFAARAWRRLKRMFGRPPYETIDKEDAPSIDFVGLFDTVEAFGVPFEEMRIAIDRLFWPISFRNGRISHKVRVVRHALSLDDERTTFHPLRIEPEPAPDGQPLAPDRIKEVWFTGVHSDIGGGYPDGALSYVPLIWMLDELRRATDGLRFKDGAVEGLLGAASAYGLLHDSREGLGVMYRYDPRSTNGKKQNGDDLSTSTLIHHSVVERMVLGSDNYAPIALSNDDALVVFPDGKEQEMVADETKPGSVYYDRPAFETLRRLGKPNQDYIDLTHDLIWWRRRVYFALVTTIGLLALAPWTANWIAESFPVHLPGRIQSFIDVLPYIIGEFIELLKLILPSYATMHLEALKEHPVLLCLFVALIWGLYRWNSKLQNDILDNARRAWPFKQRLVPTPKTAPTGPLVRWLRRHAGIAPGVQAFGTGPMNTVLTQTANYIRKRTLFSPRFQVWKSRIIIPVWCVVLISIFIVPLAVGISRIVFNYKMGEGALCTATPSEKLRWLNAQEPSLYANGFSTDNICWGSGLAVERNVPYRLTIEITEPWFDGTIMTDVGGFWRENLLKYFTQTPFLRWPAGGTFQPVARIGKDGDAEWLLVSNDGSGPLQSGVEKCTRMPVRYEDTQEYCEARGYTLKQCHDAPVTFKKDGFDIRPSDYDRLPDDEIAAATKAWQESTGLWRKAECKSIHPRTTFVSDFVARKTGELFLFVNDAIPFFLTSKDTMPFIKFTPPERFHNKNRGAAKVTLERVPQAEPKAGGKAD